MRENLCFISQKWVLEVGLDFGSYISSFFGRDKLAMIIEYWSMRYRALVHERWFLKQEYRRPLPVDGPDYGTLVHKGGFVWVQN